MYKHVLITVMCAVFMVVAIAHFNTRVYAFSFDAGVDEEVTISSDDKSKAEMFANIIEANAARYVPDGADGEVVSEDSSDLEDGDYCAIEAVRIHENADTESSVLGVLYAGEHVTVQSVNGDWCSIEYDGSIAFVHRSYLERI